MNQKSKYAKKRESGKMMYGPAPKVPKHPEFKPSYPPANQFWWGEPRPVKSGFSFS